MERSLRQTPPAGGNDRDRVWWKRPRRRGLFLLWLLALLVPSLFLEGGLGGVPVYAQQVPDSVRPGLQERQFETPPTPKSTLEPEGPVIEEPAEEAPPPEVSFVLTGVIVEGSTVYADSDFLPFYEDWLGQEITLDDIAAIAATITAKYRGDGYILSRVIIPKQRISGGIVRLRVIEGFLDKVIIEGEIGGQESLLTALGTKLTAARPLKARDLERYLLLMEDLPGVGLTSVLVPSAERFGAADLVITVTQRKAEAFVALDNRGTRFIGPLQIATGARLNGFFDHSDSTALRFITTSQTEELKFLELAHDEPLGAEGTRLALSASVLKSAPGFTLAVTDIRSRATRFSARLTHPVIRARRENLSAAAEFTIFDTKTKILSDIFSEDRLRILRLGLTYDSADSLGGINLIDARLSQGLNILNATESGSRDLSREKGRSDFTKVTAEVSRRQRLGAGFSFEAAAMGQYAFDQLLVSEEFGLGGRRFGRAYDPFEITGDHGAAVRGELQYTGPPLNEYFRAWQLFFYYDWGAVVRIDPGRSERTRSLASLGGGLRFDIHDMFSGSVEIAQPLTRPVAALGEDGKDKRVFFNLSARF